jgi:hypothetical protein
MDSKHALNGFKSNPRGYILIQSLTLVRIPLSVIFLIVLSSCKESTLTLIIGLCLLLLIETTDAIDGHIARHFNLASEYGATLDPYADSISRLIIYSTLGSKNLVFLLVPLTMALRDITVIRQNSPRKKEPICLRTDQRKDKSNRSSDWFLPCDLGPFLLGSHRQLELLCSVMDHHHCDPPVFH